MKDNFNAQLQWCRGFSHWKITSAKLAITIITSWQWFEKFKLDQFNSTLLKHFTSVEPVYVVWVIGPKLTIHFCTQQCSVVDFVTLWYLPHWTFFTSLANACEFFFLVSLDKYWPLQLSKAHRQLFWMNNLLNDIGLMIFWRNLVFTCEKHYLFCEWRTVVKLK